MTKHERKCPIQILPFVCALPSKICGQSSVIMMVYYILCLNKSHFFFVAYSQWVQYLLGCWNQLFHCHERAPKTLVLKLNDLLRRTRIIFVAEYSLVSQANISDRIEKYYFEFFYKEMQFIIQCQTDHLVACNFFYLQKPDTHTEEKKLITSLKPSLGHR